MPPFVSMNGLAGDVVVLKGIISGRQIEISSLRERVTELEKTQEEESEVIEANIKRRTKDLEKQLRATKRERSKKLKDSETENLKRDRVISLRGRVVELESTREVKVEAVEGDINRRIKDIENQLKATTKERSAKLEELELACLTRTGPIIERIEELQQLNDHDKSLIAPIRKLPPELLGHVFQYHINLNNSPWVLTLVSRSWRHTAMTTPSLWVHLSLYSAEHRRIQHSNGFKSWRIDKYCWYSKGRRVVCHDPSGLNTIISRSGSLPLDIHISYRKDNASLVQSVLGDTAIARRVASLSIDGASPLGMPFCHEVAGVTVGSFPLLHTLTISTIPEKLRDEILESISSSSPHLRHLETYQSIPLSLNFHFWPKLRSLNLSRGSTKELFNNLLPHLGELEILEGCPPGWPNSSTPEVTLAKLTTLEVFCSPEYLCKLRLPALLHLSINEVFSRAQMKTDGEPLISLPALEILDVDTRTSLSWLALLSAPCLRVFILRRTGPVPSVEASSFQNIRFPTVQDFTLDYPCTDEWAISTLECVPNAAKVAMSSMDTLYSQKPWGREILQRLADEEDILCPHVTHFTLGSLNNRAVVNKTSAKAYARRVMKGRMDRGVKMEHFEIHFKAGRESVQYA
jgi:F-box-like